MDTLYILRENITFTLKRGFVMQIGQCLRLGNLVGSWELDLIQYLQVVYGVSLLHLEHTLTYLMPCRPTAQKEHTNQIEGARHVLHAPLVVRYLIQQELDARVL